MKRLLAIIITICIVGVANAQPAKTQKLVATLDVGDHSPPRYLCVIMDVGVCASKADLETPSKDCPQPLANLVASHLLPEAARTAGENALKKPEPCTGACEHDP